MSRRVGKIDTTTVLLIGGAVAVFLLVNKKPATPATVYVPTVPSGGGSGISTGQYVQLGTSIVDAISNIFG